MAYTIGLVCDVGVGPAAGGRERNEDSYLLCCDGGITWRTLDGDRSLDQPGDGVLLAVCDGMGGHDDGHVASATAAQVLAKLYQPGAPKRPARVLLKYLLDSHRQLYWAARNDGPVSMGTTVTAVWLLNGTAAWAHVGDSRLYLCRSGRLFQLTADQTRNEFARRDGRPVSVEGDHLVQSFIYGSRGLGDNTSLRLEHGLDSGAEVLHRGDRLLVCSDGLTSAVPDDVILATLQAHDEPQLAANALLKLALERGSTDNVTIVVVRVDDPGEAVDEWVDDAEETVQF